MESEPELVRARAAQRDQVPVDIVQIEEPLQLRPHRHLGERPIRRSLLIRQKLNRHEADDSYLIGWFVRIVIEL
ncbi:hypothetical protein GCM10017600_25770 [Streptosporangium carneum]|uniref:Uncharacterized protein n=1 Tax=Streptosporangium carneum TaxID=47481 RepID=A0A9W6I0G2_9ACTN|nr:hypothetical protein GCM10017600_25770 [Streptosporangium carneum]